MKLKAVEFYVSLIMMGFCINLFTVDANFDMGPRSIFFTDGQFLTILREFVFIFANITSTSFAIAEKGREGESRNYFIREKFASDKLHVIFEISLLFPYKIFSWPKLSPTKNSPWQKVLSEKQVFWGHIDLCRKPLRMKFH